ncbi:MAG: membrane protein insertion efficiency factor YidD [Bacteroidales bacterium]|nr:membrane protein insertion efficiency factor YidD [Bacteroidales bacterium]
MALGKIVAACLSICLCINAEAQLHFSVEADFLEEITDGKTINILSKGHLSYHQGCQILVQEYVLPTTITTVVRQPQIKQSILYQAVNAGFAATSATDYNFEPVAVAKRGTSAITTYKLPPQIADTLLKHNQTIVCKIMTSQTGNRLDAEIMFDKNDSVIGKTFYYDYETIGGVDFPTRTISVTYGEKELYVKNIYSHIEFDKFEPDSSKIYPTEAFQRDSLCEEEGKTFYNGLFAFYKRIISPQDIQQCSFYPSCSQYSKITFSQNGFFYGFADTFDRLLRCNGIDKNGYIFDENRNRLIDYPLKRKK